MSMETLLLQARSSDADTRQKAAVLVVQSSGEQGLPLVFELLGDKDWRVRKTIVDGLLKNPTEQVIQWLLTALHDPENAGKRNSATEAMVRIGARAIPFILHALEREPDVDVRLSLVNLLGDLRSDEGLETLLALLVTEDDVNILSSIVASIGKHRQTRAISRLIPLLQREDLWLKFHIVEALGEIGDRSALPAILPLYGEKSLRKPVLESIGKIADVGTIAFLLKIISEDDKLNLTALRALMRIAESDKPRVIEAAERNLIRRKFREAFPHGKVVPLIEHLRLTPKREIKNFILEFLGWSGDERALPLLLEYLDQPESSEVAAQALIEFGKGASESVLQALKNSEDDELTALLLRVANMIGGTASIPTVIEFLDHDNAMIRRLAIETLGEIVDASTINYLLTRLDDPDVGCQQAAVNSISALVTAFPETKTETLSHIRKLLDSPSVPVRLNSLVIYVNIQGEGYPDELLLASKEDDQVIRQKAVSLMGRFRDDRFADQLVLSLADESTLVRVAAIEAIVKLRPEKGVAPLISLLDDSDVWIWTAAAQALGEYRHPDAVEPLSRHLTSEASPVRIAVLEALGKSESAAVSHILFSCLEDPDIEIRRAAILALGRIPGNEVLETLLRYLGHDDWRLRAASATALGHRGELAGLEPLHASLAKDPDAYVQQSVVLALDRFGNRASFAYLMKALDNRGILDDVSDLFVHHKETFRDLLEQAWRTADSRHEVVIAAILQAMKERG